MEACNLKISCTCRKFGDKKAQLRGSPQLHKTKNIHEETRCIGTHSGTLDELI